MRTIQNILIHVTFIMAGIFITFLILDIYNPTMEFVNNATSLKLLWAFCLITIVNSLLAVFIKQNDRNLSDKQ